MIVIDTPRITTYCECHAGQKTKAIPRISTVVASTRLLGKEDPWQGLLFGSRYGDWQEALEDYQAKVHDLQLGKKPEPQTLTIEQLCNLYLHSKHRAVESGEFAERSWRDYRNVAKRIVEHFGADRAVEQLSPIDFGEFRATIAKGRSVTSLANIVRVARSVF
jgi:hypothetical protein